MKKISCIVPDCGSVDSQNEGANTKFHQIPKEAEVRKKWLKAIKRTEGEVNKRSKVCSKHFKTDDYAITRLNYGVGGKTTASGSKNTCEFKALKTEAVPNMNLPPKSTFKIKISKKDNSKQIKVEEIKVKEEKVEKPERVKMPKRPAPPDSPPRSRTQSRRAASKEALKQMQLLLDDENDAVEIPDDVIPVAPSPSPTGPPPKKKHKPGRKPLDINAKPTTDRDAIVLQTITNRDAENTLELDCWVEQPDQIHKDRRKKYLDEQKELQDKLDALVAENHAKVIFKNESNTIIEVCEQIRSAVEGAEKPPTSVIINNNSGGTQSYNLLMDPTAGLVASAPIQITPPTPPPPVIAVTPQKAPQGRIQVAQDLQQTPPPAPTTPRVATRNRARSSTSKNTPPPPAPVTTPPPTRSKATPAQSTPPVQTPPTRNQTRAQIQTTPTPKPLPAAPQTRGQVQPATPQTRGQVPPATPQTRGQVQPATPQTRGQVQNTPQTRGQNAQTRGQNTSRAAQIPPPTPAQTRAQAAAATVTTTPPQTRGKKQVNTRARGPGSNTFTTSIRPSETNVEGGLSAGSKNVVEVDLTSTDEETSKLPPDSREIAFNKLQGKTYPSLVVVARPHLRARDLSLDRPKLDAKVKSVLMHAPPKFTEWLIQQGLIRSEQKCTVHTNTQLKLGMYSDVSKFPYSGGYVWISECCPQRFVSVFSGSLFEGSPHPPVVILKLLYHWACQTNIQNVVQWVKVDNLYVKGMFTWLRSICTVGLQSHFRQLGGPGVKVEVGVISLGTSSQDGSTRQVKVEVLGVLESESKLIRLRAVEPQTDGDRSYKKRFSKILEPLISWVHPHSMLVADMTVDKQALYNMGFTNVVVSTVVNNNQIMEYLRRIVPRMFQNTLSLLSRQIIQQFLDELVWREWFGTSSLQAFDSVVQHLAEQTRFESGMSLIVRLNKVAQNPFKSWNMIFSNTPKPVENNATNATNATTNNSKKSRNARKPEPPKVNQVTPGDVNRPPKSTSPDVPEQMVPLESYYYGTIETYTKTPTITLNMKCPFCKSVFDNNVQLMSHLFKHAHNVSMDAQLCRYCLTSVATANDLLKHIATSHPAETKFDNGFCCLICETPYMNPFILGKHMSKEHCPSELPYQCGTCGYRCSNHKQAIDHFYKAHDNGPTIQCPFCLKSTTVFTSSRNIVQNMNYFIQHLQKHQRKNLARRCGKCNSWFVQKDALNDHQKKMHISQRGKPELVPWTAPRNGIMVPKSKMDKYPVDAEVIDFDALKLDLSKGLMCKECDTPMDTPKHFPSFESCQNPNCQYSTCCTNAMQEHNAKCSKTNNPIAEEKLPFEMFCICGFSNIDGNQMAKHLATCERKSAYPSRTDARSATVTHSMLDVLGLVRKAEEIPKPTENTKSDDSKPKPRTEKRKRAKNEEEPATDGDNAQKDSVEVKEKEDETDINKRKRRRLHIYEVGKKKESTGDVVTVVDDKDEVNKKDGEDIQKEEMKDKPEPVKKASEEKIENKDVEQPLSGDKSTDLKSKDDTLETEEKLKQDDTTEPMDTTENVDESVTNTTKDADGVKPSENVEAEASENEQSSNLQNHVDDSESTSEEKQESEEVKENLADSKDDKSEDAEVVHKGNEEINLTKENELEDKDLTEINEEEEETSSKKGDESGVENQTDNKLHEDEGDNEESISKNISEDKNDDNLEEKSKEENLEEESNEEENLEKSREENFEEESREHEESQEEESQDNIQNMNKDDKEEIGDEGESKDNESLDDKEYSEESQEVQNKHEEEAKVDEDEPKVQSEEDAETRDGEMEEQEEKQVDDDQELDKEDGTTEDKVDVNEDKKEDIIEEKEEDEAEEKEEDVAVEKEEDVAEEKEEDVAEEKEEDLAEEKEEDLAEEKGEDVAEEKEEDVTEEKDEDVAEEKEEDVAEENEEDVAEEKVEAVAEAKEKDVAEEKEEDVAEEMEEDGAEDKEDVNEDNEDVLLEDKEEDATDDKEEDVTDDKEEGTVEDKEGVAEEHEDDDEDREEINKDEDDDESEEVVDVHKSEETRTNKELNEVTENEQDDLECSEKQSEDLNSSEKQSEDLDISEKQSEDMDVSEKQSEDLDVSEKQSEDLDVSEKQSEDLDVSEKQSEDFDVSEKQSLDFEGPEDRVDLQNHVTDDSTEATERPANKQPEFSSDDLHNILSDAVGETDSDSKNPDDVTEMTTVADSGGEGSTPMDTD
ncbi:uncharacterized protein row isoform X2 [Diabrotica undecimpunctata]|uniref:uncharacterized protein row isoform X2 n=1 Tax=Diabrotica undecimpunctata TaxID=50387 RepID=UPI003B63B101